MHPYRDSTFVAPTWRPRRWSLRKALHRAHVRFQVSVRGKLQREICIVCCVKQPHGRPRRQHDRAYDFTGFYHCDDCIGDVDPVVPSDPVLHLE